MSSTVKMIAVPPWMLGDIWPRVGGLLFKGVLSGGETDPEFAMGDLTATATGIVEGRHQLWLVIQEGPSEIIAAFCTSIMINDDGTNTVHIHTMAGEGLPKWGHLLAPTIDAFAKAEGARSVTYEGREGWSRVLPATATGRVDGVTRFERVLQ